MYLHTILCLTLWINIVKLVKQTNGTRVKLIFFFVLQITCVGVGDIYNKGKVSTVKLVIITQSHLDQRSHFLFEFYISSVWYFLCHLRSIAAHRDHFVRRLSVRLCVYLSGSHTFLVVTHSYVSQATHAFLGMQPLCSALLVKGQSSLCNTLSSVCPSIH